MRIPRCVFVPALVLVAWLPAFADSPAQLARARQFIDHGAAITLAACDLPRTCLHRSPITATGEKRQTGNDLDVDQRHLVFDGLDVEFLYVLGSFELPKITAAEAHRHPVILELTLTTPDWPVAQGLRVGTSRAVVEKALGAHGQSTRGDSGERSCEDYVDQDTQNEALLCYVRDRLVSIKWVAWWDG